MPSSHPSKNPTNEPSTDPTTQPSVLPSTRPSEKPSYSPSTKPSASPSSKPSFHPTDVPSLSKIPSFLPSGTPTLNPTNLPSTIPSLLPTTAPSFSPSFIPSSMPSLPLQSFAVEVEMEFDDCQPLTGSTLQKWQDETAGQILKEFILLYPESWQPNTLEVWTTLKSQGKPDADVITNSTTGNTTSAIPEQNNQTRMLEGQEKKEKDKYFHPQWEDSQKLRRKLQVKSPLLILFTVEIEFKSIRSFLQKDIEIYIGQAFNTKEKQINYIIKLQNTGDRSFAAINRVSVKVNGTPVPISGEEPYSKDTDTKADITLSKTIIIIIAVVTVIAVFICCTLLIWFCRNKNRRKSTSMAHPDQRMASIVQVPYQEEDISTLGDPMCIPSAMFGAKVEQDETVAASHLSAGYDYDMMAYGGTGDTPSISTAGGTKSAKGNSTRSGLISDSGGSGSGRQRSTNSNVSDMGLTRNESLSLFSDDASFEKQYDEQEETIVIVAPAGRLGVVIDTPNGGVPIVHAIKDTSILADKIRVGDRLISVDDEDTTEMTAIKVSRLISTRSQNPSRILVFLRDKVGDQ